MSVNLDGCFRRHLPHDVVVARYKEDKRRKELIELGLDPGPDPDRERYQDRGQRDRFPDRNRPGWEDREPNWRFGQERGGGWDDRRERDFGRGREERFMDRRFPPMDRDPWGPPSFPDRGPPPPPPGPPPPMSDEERYRRMYEYERQLLFFPEVGVSPDEARARMFYQYERLGIPYNTACDRVILQENRRVRVMEMVRDGLDVDDACNRVLAAENRRQLIRQYEKLGLTPREAKYRVIVEEERRKLFEEYERRGLSPTQARQRIISGEDRMHLIREFERHGMPPDVAQERATAEEERLRRFEESLQRGQGERGLTSMQDNQLDDLLEQRMLENYMEQGLGRQDAENKVIARLRQQGVPTQEVRIAP